MRSSKRLCAKLYFHQTNSLSHNKEQGLVRAIATGCVAKSRFLATQQSRVVVHKKREANSGKCLFKTLERAQKVNIHYI